MQPSAGPTDTSAGWAAYRFRSGWQIALALLAIAGAVFGLPYLIPVSPSVSLSYAAGFNNHAAVVFFILGSLLFAFLLPPRPNPVAEDRPLTRAPLFWALLVISVLCAVRLKITVPGSTIGEAPYFLDRLDHLSRGLLPYRQFEFAYGPLMLYPEAWTARLLHLSNTTGYSIVWFASWLIGVCMLWDLVRSIDIPTRRRAHIFALICMLTLPSFVSCGLNYTLLRTLCAAYVVLIVHRVCWKWQRPLWTGAAAILGVLFALGYSPEQGVGVALGLAVYLTWLALRVCRVFSWSALALTLAAFAAEFVLADRLSMLRTMLSFSSGGFNFPLLPSFAICLVLASYLSAACVLVDRVRRGLVDSLTLPMVCAGAAMLPAAMGRCDIGHFDSAWPAMLVGVFAIFSRTSVGRWWIPVTWCVLAVPTAVAGILIACITARGHVIHPTLPCDRIYLAPTGDLLPSPCTDTGYYMGDINVVTPAQIQSKIDELAAHPDTPLLLRPGATPQASFAARQDKMSSLYGSEGSFFVPRQRNPSLSLAPVAAYVVEHYRRQATLENGITVWIPRPPSGATMPAAPDPAHP
jgi:hypothetical protein